MLISVPRACPGGICAVGLPFGAFGRRFPAGGARGVQQRPPGLRHSLVVRLVDMIAV